MVIGPSKGHKNTLYEYSAVSTDRDKDTLQYIFDWGDGNITTTETSASGISVIQIHKWKTAGHYILMVKSSDNKTESATTAFPILIDVLDVANIGYLIDENSDGIYDVFYSNTTEKKQKLKSSTMEII